MPIKIPPIPDLKMLKEGSIAFTLHELDDGTGRCAVVEVSLWGSKEEGEAYCRLAAETGELFENGRTYH